MSDTRNELQSALNALRSVTRAITCNKTATTAHGHVYALNCNRAALCIALAEARAELDRFDKCGDGVSGEPAKVLCTAPVLNGGKT